MRTTIEQLLLLAKGEDGHLRVARESIDLAALAEGLVSLYAPAAERMGKTIQLSVGAVRTLADRALVERALANLLDNALRHSVPGSAIEVGVAAAGGQAIVTVEDSGPGVPECDRERVFDRFVRLDPARGTGGVGLGLTMARMIARLHDGDVAVERSRLGGAAFRLTLARALS
jgi:signal transduction histidine kinase